MSDLFDFLSRVAGTQNSGLAKERKVFGGDWKEILPESSTHNLSSLCPSILRPKHLLSEFCQDPKIFHTLFLLRQISFSSFFSPGKFLFQAFFPTNFFHTLFLFRQISFSSKCCAPFATRLGIFQAWAPTVGSSIPWFLGYFPWSSEYSSMIFRKYFWWFYDLFSDFQNILSVIFWSLWWFQNNLSIISIIFPMIFIMIFQWFLLSMIFRKYFQWFNDLFHDFPNTFQSF